MSGESFLPNAVTCMVKIFSLETPFLKTLLLECHTVCGPDAPTLLGKRVPALPGCMDTYEGRHRP